ncbi:cell division control protein 6 [Halorhabdus tiamatea SARL4B]|uniref:ORC1-type DNA replication protein n=1 Tax=Halorhabdus tiamatea SARL4B TaxID=1033806 RepID=F7PGC0_9EURY|nr:orc1/cdc6 family replication initiation protein [Halorhabdus tiamatea]ERJ05392.1 cell division control protein 6 [Halorhabdus tiamatea SARL4B]CCQ33136.1 orc1/cdc6 family replication initiation protein [Halorhabdus tiamatea SARL4B]
MFDSGETDGIFETGSVFANRELLRVGHVPDLERVVGRDEEINAIGAALGPATVGGPPETTIIYGKTGTGKSLVARCVTREAHEEAKTNDVSLAYAYVDCSDYQTEAKASREMARELVSRLDTETDVPRVGIAASDYRDIVWELLNEFQVAVFVVILDEIDKLDDDELLRSLSRARESGKVDAHVGAICISNKIEYRERLNERIDSSLQDNELIFDPYDAGQLRAILEHRTDAFADDVLDGDVIPKVAALAAKEHGDARKAVDTLYEAGRLAEKQGLDTVSVEHVDDAVQQAEINRFQKLVSGTTPHVKHILHALALLTANNPEQEAFRTHRIYDLYTRIVEREDATPLSEDRVYRLLKEQAFLGVTESNHTGGGQGEGSYLEHRLLRDPDIVVKALENSEPS